MVTLSIVNDLPEAEWRQFVEAHPHGSLFHTPEMGRVFAHARGHVPTLWAAVQPGGRALALMTPVHITLMNGPLNRLTTRTVAFGSVLCEPGDAGRAALAQLLPAYIRATQGRTLFTELRNYADLSAVQPVLTQCHFVYEPHLNYFIDLTQPVETLWRNVRANARRNVQRARKSGVIIEALDDPQELPAVYALLRNVYARIRVPLPERSLFEAAFVILHPLGKLKVLVARLNGVAIGALTLLLHQGVMVYWYTGTLREYAEHRAGDLLVWHALELGHQLGCHLFDFGGAGKPDEAYGVRDFKSKFGGELVNLGRNVHVPSPLRLRVSQWGYELYRRLRFAAAPAA